MKSDVNIEWLDVEDMVWDIFDQNQSRWGHSFNECKTKIIALRKTKNLTSLFRGSHASKDLNEIIEMKIDCLIRDYILPVKNKIIHEERENNLNKALYLAHSELRKIISVCDTFPQFEKSVLDLKNYCKRLEKIANTGSVRVKETIN